MATSYTTPQPKPTTPSPPPPPPSASSDWRDFFFSLSSLSLPIQFSKIYIYFKFASPNYVRFELDSCIINQTQIETQLGSFNGHIKLEQPFESSSRPNVLFCDLVALNYFFSHRTNFQGCPHEIRLDFSLFINGLNGLKAHINTTFEKYHSSHIYSLCPINFVRYEITFNF